MQETYESRIKNEVKNRYRKLHGKAPPYDYLKNFTFYNEHSPPIPGGITLRKLRSLGLPRVSLNPVITGKHLNKKKKRILHAGCSTGCDTRWLYNNKYAGKDGVVIGIDNDPAVIKLGRAFYRDEKVIQPIFMEGDVLGVNPKKNSRKFDIIYSKSVISSMPSYNAALEFVQVARNAMHADGIFFGETLGTDYHVDDFTALQLSAHQIRETLEYGFDVKLFEVSYFKEQQPKFRAFYMAVPTKS